jgi:hypothetical protein
MGFSGNPAAMRLQQAADRHPGHQQPGEYSKRHRQMPSELIADRACDGGQQE